MSLVTTKDLMLDAQKNHYAIGAFNAENMEMKAPASRGETIEEACEVHGVNCDELLEKLNTHLAAKKA